MEEEIRFFWYCLTPQSPWLQHLWLANGLSGWRQGGVGLRDEENNGAECLSQHYLAAPLSLLLTHFFSLQQISPANRSFVLWREHTLQTHTHIHTLEEREKVSGGWVDSETEKKQSSVRV